MPSSLIRCTAPFAAALAAAALPSAAFAQSDLQGWYAGLDAQQSRIERTTQTTLDADVVATTGLTSNGGYAKAGRFDGHRSGVQWGLGWRWALSERWSLRAEWLQTDLGDVAIENAYLPGSTFVDPAYIERYRIDVETRQLRVGLSVRF